VTPLARSSGYRAKKFVQRNPFLVGLALAMVGLGAALARSWVRGDRLDRSAARELLAMFASDPKGAAQTTINTSGRIRRYASDLTRHYLGSDAFTERVVGSRAGVVFDPKTFWQAVEAGPLWRFGEWLDVVAYSSASQTDAKGAWPVSPDLVLNLIEPLSGTGGSARQKYVALCLLGQMQIEGAGLTPEILGLSMKDSNAGVAAAARWCASRNGVATSSKDGLFADEVSGLTFAAIPGVESFKRGSDPSDPDRFANESQSPQGIAIKPFHLSTTEVTHAAIRPFFADPGSQALLEFSLADLERTQAAGFDASMLSRVAVGFMSLEIARHYCNWLNQKASAVTPARKYRVPTEDEWEYACRAGNPGRFCFGDNAEYARYFAHCNGSTAPYHTVAERMPNAFGLFDMHGGLWELTETRYPSELAPPEFQSSELYVKKGGAWHSPAVRCRSAQRNFMSPRFSDPSAADRYTGFRVVMELTP